MDDELGFAVSAVAGAECASSDSVAAIAPAITLSPYCFRNCLRVKPRSSEPRSSEGRGEGRDEPPLVRCFDTYSVICIEISHLCLRNLCRQPQVQAHGSLRVPVCV